MPATQKILPILLAVVAFLVAAGHETDRVLAQWALSPPSASATTTETVLEALEVVRLYEQGVEFDRVPVITCIDLEREGKLLALGGDDHSVRLWDVENKLFVRQLGEHLDWVRGLAFSPDRTRLATIGQDGQVKLWNVQTGELLKTVGEPVRGTQQVEFHPDGSRFAVCGFGDTVRIYETAAGNLLETLTAHGTNNRALAFSPDGALLAVAGRTGVIRVWQTADTRQPLDMKGDGRRINALAFSDDGTRLACGGDGPYLLLWNPATGELTDTLPERPGKTFSLAFCGPNLLASGESDNAIRIWDLQTRQSTTTLLGHTGTISTMVFEPATGRLISGSFDTSIRFWNVADASAGQPVPQPPLTTQTTEPAFPALTLPTETDAVALPLSPFAIQ